MTAPSFLGRPNPCPRASLHVPAKQTMIKQDDLADSCCVVNLNDSINRL
eukprot:CAMPEP_0175809156 /NCGR_PEP_ID=MMETSP0107_2-20121207/2646_1 /TAXON_ID=195067 ORGANISM="Goniomonas pacifica, Strain CCMP1869" /NCGR_SAMPLE_ID=MMETSP0107_2 /ASSEMBLY_ACC=CAM_ASM_000203 /LENGTH=48 /DNA_ID= /DNA_START= /DNA_END= /DNA_ORIENTATION=